MAVEGGWNRQRIARIGFALLIVACIAPLVVRSLLPETGPSVQVLGPDGSVRTITLSEMKEMPALTREGVYQNQYGNWRDQGIYSGVRLADLVGTRDYSSVEVIADDGYRVTIDRARVEDPEYPMILAYRMDSRDVPEWKDGFRIAVLPEDGNVGNEEYGVESAGSFWVKRVVQLDVRP
jgi:hypothetical protein